MMDKHSVPSTNLQKSRDLLTARGYYMIQSGNTHGVWNLVGVRASGDGPATILVAVADRRPSRSIMGAVQGLHFPDATKMLHIWCDGQAIPEEIVVANV